MKFYLLFFLPAFVFAQKGYVMGKVLDIESKRPLELCLVQNLRTKAMTKSNERGDFFILTKAMDTLEFYTMGYKRAYLGVMKTMKDTTIFLRQDANQLNEVIITAKREQTIRRDIQDFNSEPTVSKNIDGGEIFEAIQSPTGIYDLLSGNLKKAHRAAVARQDYIRQHLVSLRYNKALAQHITKLQDAELEKFMKFCDVPPDMVLHYSDYDLHHEILQCFEVYKNTILGSRK
jgi:hypothetical protein